MPIRYSGDLIIRIKILESENYVYRCSVILPPGHRLDRKEVYRVTVGASEQSKRTRSEDSPDLIDDIARAAIVFSPDHFSSRCAYEPEHCVDRVLVGRSPRYSWRFPPLSMKKIKALHRGDEVYWNDPDRDKCSRYYKIQSIEIVKGKPTVVQIQEPDGSYLECLASELS